MASDYGEGLVTRVTNDTGADLADAEVLTLDISANAQSAIDPDNSTDRGKVPAVVIPKFRHKDTVEDGDKVPAVSGGVVKAKVDGSGVTVAAGDLLKISSGSNKFTKWVNAGGLAEPAAATTVGSNTGTAAAGLSAIGDTSTGDQSAAIMNDLRALQEDVVELRDGLVAALEYIREVRGIALEASSADAEMNVCVYNNPLSMGV